MARRSRQLALSLRLRPRWGGARDGAGRKTGPNPAMRHLARERFGRPLPTHVTLRMRAGVPSLRTAPLVREVERSFAVGCERPGFRLVHYSLQGNHAHLVVEAADQAALGRGMKCIGARLARAVNRVTGHRGAVLADRYHHHLLRTPREVHRALRYVLLNARHHVGKVRVALARTVRFDPASSARFFDGWKLGLRAVPSASEPAASRGTLPVARARTWLLTTGWRRHGLLDPADVPG